MYHTGLAQSVPIQSISSHCPTLEARALSWVWCVLSIISSIKSPHSKTISPLNCDPMSAHFLRKLTWILIQTHLSGEYKSPNWSLVHMVCYWFWSPPIKYGASWITPKVWSPCARFTRVLEGWGCTISKKNSKKTCKDESRCCKPSERLAFTILFQLQFLEVWVVQRRFKEHIQ